MIELPPLYAFFRTIKLTRNRRAPGNTRVKRSDYLPIGAQHKPSIDKNWPSSDLFTASSATTAAEFIGPYMWGNCCCPSAPSAGSSPAAAFECAGLSPTGAAGRTGFRHDGKSAQRWQQ